MTAQLTFWAVLIAAAIAADIWLAPRLLRYWDRRLAPALRQRVGGTAPASTLLQAQGGAESETGLAPEEPPAHAAAVDTLEPSADPETSAAAEQADSAAAHQSPAELVSAPAEPVRATPEVIGAEPPASVSHVQLSFDLAPGARIRITIEDIGQDGIGSARSPIVHQVVLDPATGQPIHTLQAAPWPPAERPAFTWPAWTSLRPRAQSALAGAFDFGRWPAGLRGALDVRDHPLAVTLFGLALAVYTLTRFIGLAQFPIYFFSDEAVQTVLAADFVRDGFRDFMGRSFPTYFQNGTYFNLSTSVYAQVLPYILFGRSVVVTRGVSVLASVLGAAALGLTLKNIFNVRWWWAGVMLLSITPAWFLHSRTAFETVLMASLYAWFLYFYLLYRFREPRYLFPALVCGALAFYTYNGGQAVVVLTGLFLLISDFGYHWANRRTGWWGLALLGVLVLPYVRFLVEQPGENWTHLRTLDSYWVDRSLTWPQRLAKFWEEYRFGLSVGYWYLPDTPRDLVRHIMKGYGHILLATLPFAVLGILVCVWRIKSPAHRALLIALLTAPAGAALASIGITRALVFVIPAALLTALGVEAVREWTRRWLPAAPLAVGAFALMAVFNFGMLRDSLANGPTWYRDYGLGGLQYGAVQVFGEIKAYLTQSPRSQILFSPSWANGTDYLLRFFEPDEPRVELESIYSFTDRQLPLTEQMLFIMTPSEYEETLRNPKFTSIRVDRIHHYPDGRPGFYFVRLKYSEEAGALFAAEAAARKELVTEQLLPHGESALVTLRYSRMDSGRIHDVFDGDTFTMGRTEEANPAIIEMIFASPRAVKGVTITTGSMTLSLTVRLYADEAAEPVVYTQAYADLPPDPTVTLAFERGPELVSKIRFEIQNTTAPETAKIHIREIVLN